MPSVLVFDDDPDVGGLVSDLVRSCGLTVEHHLSAVGVVDIDARHHDVQKNQLGPCRTNDIDNANSAQVVLNSQTATAS
jgi:CheY-like chemotaxis protein